MCSRHTAAGRNRRRQMVEAGADPTSRHSCQLPRGRRLVRYPVHRRPYDDLPDPRMISVSPDDLIRSICDENLAVYEVSPIRLREDVGQEAEIAHDYRGRIIYELLQNADDAMAGESGDNDVISIRLTDTDLWVGNSGRPLDADDVRGLCGIGASSKGGPVKRKRASIGHKGMGFKSVLEITEAPEVVSETFAFRLGAAAALTPVSELMARLNQPTPSRVPSMRFPSALHEVPQEWRDAQARGIRTLFRFPLRQDMGPGQRDELAQRLINLPVTAILFLKHLERIEIDIETSQRAQALHWTILRSVRDAASWRPIEGLSQTGLYRVQVEADDGDQHEFLVAHGDDLEIGPHRGGLDAYAWTGVEVSEVSVAVPVADGRPAPVDAPAQVLHVFLPTGEACPYPVVINGAFSADLSRQEVRVSEDPNDYNRWLLSQAARILLLSLMPSLRDFGASDADVVRLLDRGAAQMHEPASTPTGQVLVDAIRAALTDAPLVRIADGARVPLPSLVVPPLVDDEEVGALFRSLLSVREFVGGRSLPPSDLCGGRAAFVMADHGTHVLRTDEAPQLLAESRPASLALAPHPSTPDLRVDPIVDCLERLWDGLPTHERGAFVAAVRAAKLFPTDGDVPGQVRRIAVAERDCFYPPRTLSGSVPLADLCFMARDICWGELTPTQRQDLLRRQLSTWQALFGVREFKFPDVMRSSVLPALTLGDDGRRSAAWHELCEPETLAAVCQLSGRTPNPGAPLPYERLGTSRALFNLARLPVPCRGEAPGSFTWQPAYRAYFGADWVGDASVERVIDAIRGTGRIAPEVPLLAGPEVLVPLLQRYAYLGASIEADDADDEEVGLDEDEEAALDSDHRDRWVSFLTWLGVNHALRPVHFSDVEDRQAGWLTTKGLARPSGWAFRRLSAQVWEDYRQRVASELSRAGTDGGAAHYFYELHDLEFLVDILGAVQQDASCDAARALFVHLAENWSQLQRFTHVTVAAVPKDRVPSMRSKPPRAQDDELVRLGDNLWLHRLRSRAFLPTTHGPGRPQTTWMRTHELDRRFARGQLDSGQLLPVLAIDATVTARARTLCTALGLRGEPTSSNFNANDARTVLDRLAAMFPPHSGEGRQVSASSVRQMIRPTYRTLTELLPGSDGDSFAPGALADAPLLVDDARGHYRFSPGSETLWMERNGTRARLGDPEDLWTFVLDASPGARGPLTRLFGVRVLEQELRWEPEPGEVSLDQAEFADFRAGLHRLAPFILARLSAERSNEQLQASDASTLRRLIGALLPVQDLRVGCRLGGRRLAAGTIRPGFVARGAEGAAQRAFVVWGEHGWPPAAEANALATVLADALGAGHFEAFLALIQAPDDAARRNLLTLAGAPTDVESFAGALSGGNPTTEVQPANHEPELTLPKQAADEALEVPVEPPPLAPDGVGPISMAPLYTPEDLVIGGTAVSIAGEAPSNAPTRPQRSTARAGGRSGSTTGYGGLTDLSALDRLGMHVAMAYEVNRLCEDGLTDAQRFDPDDPADQRDAYVFDVSSPALIAVAHQRSESFRDALAQLMGFGVNQQHPGCDILTLRPDGPSPIDRLIELKSSGHHARTQAMTWNEWKTAQNDDLRSHFFLYLVANLRSDLPDARPFLRAVRDPYATISADEHEGHSTTRHVVLRVEEFEEAEHLEIGVRFPNRTSARP